MGCCGSKDDAGEVSHEPLLKGAVPARGPHTYPDISESEPESSFSSANSTPQPSAVGSLNLPRSSPKRKHGGPGQSPTRAGSRAPSQAGANGALAFRVVSYAAAGRRGEEAGVGENGSGSGGGSGSAGAGAGGGAGAGDRSNGSGTGPPTIAGGIRVGDDDGISCGGMPLSPSSRAIDLSAAHAVAEVLDFKPDFEPPAIPELPVPRSKVLTAVSREFTRYRKQWRLGQVHYLIKRDSDNRALFHCFVRGLQGSLVEGTVFVFYILYTNEYPVVAPEVVFTPPVFHPNVDIEGSVDIPILGSQWKKKTPLTQIVSAVQAMLEDGPILDDVRPRNQEAAVLYSRDPEEFFSRCRRSQAEAARR